MDGLTPYRPYKEPEARTDRENTIALIGEDVDEMTDLQLETLYQCVQCIKRTYDSWECLSEMLKRINDVEPFM